jgi:hypothetical protein
MFALSRFSFAITTSEVRHTEIKHAFIANNADTVRALPGTECDAETTH